MNRSNEPLFDPRLADWLEDDPHAAPDGTLEVVFAAFPSIKQRRASRMPWRVPLMSAPLRLGIAATAVVIAASGGLYLIAPGPGPAVPGASPTQTPATSPTAPVTPSPTAGATQAGPQMSTASPDPLDTSRWSDFTSARYGFTIGLPADWRIDNAASKPWVFGKDQAHPSSPALDTFVSSEGEVAVSVWAVRMEPGQPMPVLTWQDQTLEQLVTWVEAFCRSTGNEPCDGIAERATPLCVERRDCHPGLMVPFASETHAYFMGKVPDEHLGVVVVWRPDNHPSVRPYGGSARLLQAFLETMGVFLPEPGQQLPGWPLGGQASDPPE